MERPKSAILIFPMPPEPIPGMNSPSSSLSSSSGAGDRGFRVGMNGTGSKRRFSGFISLYNKLSEDKTGGEGV